MSVNQHQFLTRMQSLDSAQLCDRHRADRKRRNNAHLKTIKSQVEEAYGFMKELDDVHTLVVEETSKLVAGDLRPLRELAKRTTVVFRSLRDTDTRAANFGTLQELSQAITRLMEDSAKVLTWETAAEKAVAKLEKKLKAWNLKMSLKGFQSLKKALAFGGASEEKPLCKGFTDALAIEDDAASLAAFKVAAKERAEHVSECWSTGMKAVQEALSDYVDALKKQHLRKAAADNIESLSRMLERETLPAYKMPIAQRLALQYLAARQSGESQAAQQLESELSTRRLKLPQHIQSLKAMGILDADGEQVLMKAFFPKPAKAPAPPRKESRAEQVKPEAPRSETPPRPAAPPPPAVALGRLQVQEALAAYLEPHDAARIAEQLSLDAVALAVQSMAVALDDETVQALLKANPDLFLLAQENPADFRDYVSKLELLTPIIASAILRDRFDARVFSRPEMLEGMIHKHIAAHERINEINNAKQRLEELGYDGEVALAVLWFGFCDRNSYCAGHKRIQKETIYKNIERRTPEQANIPRDQMNRQITKLAEAKVINIATGPSYSLNLHSRGSLSDIVSWILKHVPEGGDEEVVYEQTLKKAREKKVLV